MNAKILHLNISLSKLNLTLNTSYHVYTKNLHTSPLVLCWTIDLSLSRKFGLLSHANLDFRRVCVGVVSSFPHPVLRGTFGTDVKWTQGEHNNNLWITENAVVLFMKCLISEVGIEPTTLSANYTSSIVTFMFQSIAAPFTV